MMLLALPEAAERANVKSGPNDEQVRAGVWSLLSEVYPQGNTIERRSDQRWPYPNLITITPVTAEALMPVADPVVVVGKQLSERGVGFFHPMPLPYRRVIATLESASGEARSFVLDLKWCRFTRKGWYESGGRFLQVVQTTDDGTGFGPVGR